MNEDFLHYLWRYRLFGPDLRTSRGELVEVIDTGIHNYDRGPDFLNARIRIDKTLWAGHVEIHLNSSDWVAHAHHRDKSYNNVILHVVYNDDLDPNTNLAPSAPCLEVARYVDYKLFYRYQSFLNALGWVPCQNQINQTDRLVKVSWLERMLAERLTESAQYVLRLFEQTRHDWSETFYRFLARSFGLRLNVEPFEMLSASLPLSVILRHRSSLFQLEALFLGQAGFLDEDFKDDYPAKLKTEYSFLREKYHLVPLPVHLWKFLRMRPAGFPTIRLVQFADFWHRNAMGIDDVLGCSVNTVFSEKFAVEVSEYWIDHYMPDKLSVHRHKTLGDDAINRVMINTLPPILFAYGQVYGNNLLTERAVSVLDQLPPEVSNETERWTESGIIPASAAETQALHYMKKNYCDHKKCLHCRIGNFLLRKESE
ncbi:MAG: DUF2851 family protein [Bacteroidota bacterium]|nr:DUF2851 family protein [Bacteroidota bacterium]